MKGTFCVCKCFYTHNIFIKDYRVHVNYLNKRQFVQDHCRQLKQLGCKCPKYLIGQIEEEVARRKQEQDQSIIRKNYIAEHYAPKSPHVYKLTDEFLDPEFIKLVQYAKDPNSNQADLIELMTDHKKRVYSFPIFTESFCKELLEELIHFKDSDVPIGRPNTMNNNGILLDELGFNEEFFDHLRLDYINPIARLLYPEWFGDGLDSHKVFIVKYAIGEDEDLDTHFDNSEVTLNVSLNKDFEGAELYFGLMFDEMSAEESIKIYNHKLANGVLHRGRLRHGAMNIEQGERWNLVLWLRSSSVRNETCPMCHRVPNLIPVRHGTGDGFIQYSEDVCSTL